MSPRHLSGNFARGFPATCSAYHTAAHQSANCHDLGARPRNGGNIVRLGRIFFACITWMALPGRRFERTVTKALVVGLFTRL
jgi:hypothetical protein